MGNSKTKPVNEPNLKRYLKLVIGQVTKSLMRVRQRYSKDPITLPVVLLRLAYSLVATSAASGIFAAPSRSTASEA